MTQLFKTNLDNRHHAGEQLSFEKSQTVSPLIKDKLFPPIHGARSLFFDGFNKFSLPLNREKAKSKKKKAGNGEMVSYFLFRELSFQRELLLVIKQKTKRNGKREFFSFKNGWDVS